MPQAKKKVQVLVFRVSSVAIYRTEAENDEAAMTQARNKLEIEGLKGFDFSEPMRKNILPDSCLFVVENDPLQNEKAQKERAAAIQKNAEAAAKKEREEAEAKLTGASPA